MQHECVRIKSLCDMVNILHGYQLYDQRTYIREWARCTALAPGGFTLHMTGYTPACTKSVEKGSFLDIRRRRRLLQKGYIFRC